jgi:cytochrome c oxidase cbb3-type subunit III
MTTLPKSPALLDHEYDGISEYDNPIPGWWHGVFWFTVALSVAYFAFYHTASPYATTIEQDWEAMQTAEYSKIFGELGELQPDAATILKLTHDDRMMAVAKGMFVGNCAQCHAKDGGGINGVNLTDDAYKNVAVVTDLYTVITKGAGSSAMPAWENRLSQNERVLLAAYTASLRGQTPATPKVDEGAAIASWSE